MAEEKEPRIKSSRKYSMLRVPELDEFIFTCLKYMPDDARMKLAPMELKMLRSDVYVRKFSSEQTLERKMFLMAKLGFGFHLIFYPKDLDWTIFERIEDQVRSPENRVAVIKEMADKKLFVLGSKEIMNMMQMAAMNSTNGVYMLNYDYVKLGQYLKKTKGQLVNNSYEDAELSLEWMSKLLGFGLKYAEETMSICNIEKKHLHILLALYPHRSSYINSQKIKSYMGLGNENIIIDSTLRVLVKSGHIDQIKMGDRKTVIGYTISQKGIEVVTKFLKYVVNSSLYQ